MNILGNFLRTDYIWSTVQYHCISRGYLDYFEGKIQQFDEIFDLILTFSLFFSFFLMVEILGSNNKGPKIGSISGGNNGNMNSIQNGDHANLSDPDNNTEVDEEESNYVLQQVTCTKFLNFPALFVFFKILHHSLNQGILSISKVHYCIYISMFWIFLKFLQ